MPDQFYNIADQVSAPARRAVAVVPSDTVALAVVPKALFVGTGGAITMRGIDDDADVTWKNVASGTILPFRPSHVRATGTTATDLVALS